MSLAGVEREQDVSAIDEIAGAAVRLVLLSAVIKPAALQALARLALDEWALLEGDEQASTFCARRARIHHERGLNKLRRGIRSR